MKVSVDVSGLVVDGKDIRVLDMPTIPRRGDLVEIDNAEIEVRSVCLTPQDLHVDARVVLDV